MAQEIDKLAKLIERLGDTRRGDPAMAAQDIRRSAMVYAEIVIRDCLIEAFEKCLERLDLAGELDGMCGKLSDAGVGQHPANVSRCPPTRSAEDRRDPTENVVLNLIDRRKVRKAATTKSPGRNRAISVIAELIDQAHPNGLASDAIAKRVVPEIVKNTVFSKVLTSMKESEIITYDHLSGHWFVAGQAPPSDRNRSDGVQNQFNGASS